MSGLFFPAKEYHHLGTLPPSCNDPTRKTFDAQEEARAREGSRGRGDVHGSHLQVQQAALTNSGGRFMGPSELADCDHNAQLAAAQQAAAAEQGAGAAAAQQQQAAAAQQQAAAAQVGVR